MRYTQEERIAAQRGWWAGRLGTQNPTVQPYYQSLPAWSLAQLGYLYQYYRGRNVHVTRVREGREQRPGSVYNPALDDRR